MTFERLTPRDAIPGQAVIYVGNKDSWIGLHGAIQSATTKHAHVAVNGMNGGHLGSSSESLPPVLRIPIDDLCEDDTYGI